MTNDQIFKIIQAISTCVVLIASIVLSTACTLSLSVQKQNSNSVQSTEQTTTVDSLNNSVVLTPKFK